MAITAAQRRRLILVLAYIKTHRKSWKQRLWFSRTDPDTAATNLCGTYGCLAGHIAITLSPHRFVADIPAKTLNKLRNCQPLTDEENLYLETVDSLKEYLIPTKDDNPHHVLPNIVVDGKTVSGIHIRHRASRLLGQDIVGITDDSDSRSLFNGDHNWRTISAMSAGRLGISKAELNRQVDLVAAQHGWTKPKA